MNLLLAASEVAGFAKTGGLADVAAALPRALARRGHRCAIIMPLYRAAATGLVPIHATPHTVAVPVGPRLVSVQLWRATLPDSEVPVYLVGQPDYFERDDPTLGRGIYQHLLSNGQRRDYPDNCERFTVFCRAVMELLPYLDIWPEIIHNNDWQTGLIPVFLREEYRHRPGYDRIRTLFTIHNIAYQGIFRPSELATTRLDWRLFNYHQLEFYGQLNLLKAGVIFSDMLSTVSPRYAQEIQTSTPGCGGFGLEGVLRERRDHLVGILNGVDYRIWDPASDPHIAAKYSVETVERSKPECKHALQERFGLPRQPRTPLLAMISRLVDQKGVNLLGQIAQTVLQLDTQVVILGQGDAIYHRMLQELQAANPTRFGLTLAQDEVLAHQIEAGADIFLMPSWFEPCGLNQLYSLRYGTVPVVRATGGLADSVVDTKPETLADRAATGICFGPHTPTAFLAAIKRALDLYRQQPEVWLQLVRTGMEQDFSWDHSAEEYEKVYARLLGLPPAVSKGTAASGTTTAVARG